MSAQGEQRPLHEKLISASLVAIFGFVAFKMLGLELDLGKAGSTAAGLIGGTALGASVLGPESKNSPKY